MNINYQILPPGQSDLVEITNYLMHVDEQFQPPLHTRIDINDYAGRIVSNAYLITARDEANDKLIGFSAGYINKKPDFSFGTFISVLPEYQGEDFVGIHLIEHLIKLAKEFPSAGFRLMMRKSDRLLFKFYKQKGFTVISENFYPNSTETECSLELIFDSKTK